MPFSEFEANIRKHSHNNAYALGAAAQLAYETPQVVRRRAQSWGFDKLEIFDCKETQAFVASRKDAMVIAFRGTELKIKDWMTDLDIDLVQGPAGRVHEGFQTAHSYVWRDLYSYVAKTRRRSSKSPQGLWVTGHSLGAALATVCAAKLRLERDVPVNGLYTFGQPRTGDGNFARVFDQDFGATTYRYVNNNDIVARIPFRSMKYSHVGDFMYFDEKGRFNDRVSWWDKLLDRVKGRVLDVFKPGTDGLKDHSMKHYVANLQKAAASRG